MPAPAPRAPTARGLGNRLRPIAVIVVVVLIAGALGRELAVLRTPAASGGDARALYVGDPYGAGWIEVDPRTLADRNTRPLLDRKLGGNESVVTSADGSTIVVSHYGQLLADHTVYDARTGAVRSQFTEVEPMNVDGISADGAQIIGRAGSANHSMTDAKLIVSTVDGHIVRHIPAVDGFSEYAVLYDPSFTSIYYVNGPSFFTNAPAGIGPLSLVVQSTSTGATKTVPLPGIQSGRVVGGAAPTSLAPATLFFAATVLSPDGTQFAALSLDGTRLVVVDTATLAVTEKTLVRQTSLFDLNGPNVAYGKEAADNDSWSAAFSPDARTLYAFRTQSTDQGGSAVYLQTLTLERIDIARGAITAVAPATRPFTDYISALVPSSDGQSIYIIQRGRLGILDRVEAPYLRRLDARTLAVLAERPLDQNTYDLQEFQPRAAPDPKLRASPVPSRVGSLSAVFDATPAYPGYQWTRDGRPVKPEELGTIAGPAHCGWESATMLSIGWPPGTLSASSAQSRQYIRDPRGVIRGALRDRLVLGAQLPADARSTGYSYGAVEVFVSPTDQDEFIYLVGPGAVERWPRSDPMTLCS